MPRLSRTFTNPLAVAACAIPVVLASVLWAVPAEAAVAKATMSCSPGSVNPSFSTPVAASNVSAAKFGAVKGKEKVSWNSTQDLWPPGFSLYFQILTSKSQCTKPMKFEVNSKCLRTKPLTTTYWCKIKRLRSGSTEFRVAMWFQSSSGAWGPVAYSDWSASVNVK